MAEAPTPEIIRISDADDPRIAAYRDIRERDLVGRQGLFVAEGKVVLANLFGALRFEVLSVLVLESRLAGLRDTLRAAPAGLPVYVAERKVMDAVAGFPIHRGILAIGRARPTTAAEVMRALPSRALCLVLIGISNHDNMGALFRNASAFGAAAVLLDPSCCDPLYRKSIRVSVGGVFRTPFARLDDTETGLDALSADGFRLLALSPRGTMRIDEISRTERTALVLGTEGEGLPPSVLQRWTTVRIPITGGFDSLNVATAAAIALHRLSVGLV